MRLRVLAKRASTRNDRIATLEVEKKDFTSQESSLKVLLYTSIIVSSVCMIEMKIVMAFVWDMFLQRSGTMSSHLHHTYLIA